MQSICMIPENAKLYPKVNTSNKNMTQESRKVHKITIFCSCSPDFFSECQQSAVFFLQTFLNCSTSLKSVSIISVMRGERYLVE